MDQKNVTNIPTRLNTKKENCPKMILWWWWIHCTETVNSSWISITFRVWRWEHWENSGKLIFSRAQWQWMWNLWHEFDHLWRCPKYVICYENKMNSFGILSKWSLQRVQRGHVDTLMWGTSSTGGVNATIYFNTFHRM